MYYISSATGMSLNLKTAFIFRFVCVERFSEYLVQFKMSFNLFTVLLRLN